MYSLRGAQSQRCENLRRYGSGVLHPPASAIDVAFYPHGGSEEDLGRVAERVAVGKGVRIHAWLADTTE